MADTGLWLSAVLGVAAFAAGYLLDRARAAARIRKAEQDSRARQEEAARNQDEMVRARAQLQSFFEHAPVYMSLHDLGGRFAFGTRTVLDAYGASPEDLRAMSPAALAGFWPRIEEVVGATTRAATTGEPQRLVTPFRPKGGVADRLFDIVIFPIRGKDGAVVQVGSIGTDITEQRQREAEATRSRAMLQAFSDNVPAGLSIKDRARTFTMINAFSAKAYYGRKPAEIIGKSADDLRTRRHGDHLFDMEQKVLDTGEVQTRDVAYVGEDGQRYMHLIFFPIKDQTGDITHIGSLTYDTTEQKAAEAALAEREAQLSSLFEHVPADIAVFDRNHRAVMVNSSTSKAYDRESVDFVGTHPSEFRAYWPEFDMVMATGVSVFETGQSKRFRTHYVPPGKTKRVDFDGIFFPIRSKSGEVEQVGLFLLDVSSQRQAQAELAEQQANLLAFFDYAPLQVYVTDLDHKIVMLNDWVFRETGVQAFHPSNVVGVSADKMVPSSWADMSHDNDATVIGRRGVTQVEVRGQFGGKERDIISIRFPIKDADGEVVRIGGFVVDVTKQKEAERALQERLAQSHQSEKLAALGQLLAGVAHELNNPLTVVVGRSAILEEKLAGTPHAASIRNLREAADRCNRIVKTFLAMARQSAPRRGAVRLETVVEAALDMTAYGLRTAGIRLERALGPDLPEVNADEDQLIQVVTNLLLNAQHALEAHDGAREIRLGARTDGERVVLSIADSGPGVPPDLASRIFEPFFTTKEVGQGTGMGLAMSRGIIEEHGGALSYADGPNGGACFEIALPRVAGASDPAAAEAGAEAPRAARGRVLVVDDEESIREMLADILAACELQTIEAANGEEALARLSEQPFDLIISDVRMPVMDGIGLRRALAADRPEALSRLIFMSGDVLQRDRARFAEIQGETFIEKPFNPAEVRRVALEVLSRAGADA